MTGSRFIGLISGTSIDAIDCVLLHFEGDKPAVIATRSQPYDPELRRRIFALCEQPQVSLRELGQVDTAIGEAFAAAALALLEQENLSPTSISGIGSHGQTVFHHPYQPHPFTTQLGDPNTIASRSGITTVADFRRMDMAAGGQGAPLAPLFHDYCFRSHTVDRVIVNIGGIGNITLLARDKPFLGFDTGPGNVLMDYWINATRQLIYDEDGAWASSGSIKTQLLELLLDEPYFQLPPPKSTGRELFNGRWLQNKLQLFGGEVNVADVQATLLELSARTLAAAIQSVAAPDEVLVCGGGAYNKTLMGRLAELLPDSRVDTTATLGLSPDWVEAATFAWLARQRLLLRPVATGPVTGASKPCLLGGVYQPAV
ncbi:MAG: hypothetical protein RLZZ385_1844 [Pseudomonadota bacterium]|jgi:anhydro-N-acetylmuramic acid kinase